VKPSRGKQLGSGRGSGFSLVTAIADSAVAKLGPLLLVGLAAPSLPWFERQARHPVFSQTAVAASWASCPWLPLGSCAFLVSDLESRNP
jgi:hypothetical protein